jgi:tetratricopeptide (TPR) repeat protein
LNSLYDSSGNPIEPSRKKSWQQRFFDWTKKYRKTIIGFLGLGTLAGIVQIFNLFGIKDIFDIPKWYDRNFPEEIAFTQEPGFKILLLPFQPLDDCTIQDTHLEKTIQTRLLEMSENQGLGLQVLLDTNQLCPKDFDAAREIGTQMEADLVIWGDLYERCNLYNQACLKYVVVNTASYGQKGKSEIEAFKSLSEVMQGKLQRDVDYIIYWTLGLEASQKGECDKAALYFENIFKSFSDKAWISYFELATCFRNNNDPVSSVRYLNRGAEISSDNFIVAMAYYNIGVTMAELGEYQKAIANFDNTIRNYPEYVEAYYNRGYAKAMLRNFHDAIIDLDSAINLNPRYVLALKIRGNVKHELGDFKEAIADYDKALNFDSGNASVYNNRGLVQFKLGNVDGAMKDYSKAIAIDPKYVDAYANRGTLEQYLGNFEAAIRNFDTTIILDPTRESSYFNRANAKQLSGDLQGAIADYSKAIEINPDYAKAYNNRGAVKALLEDNRGSYFDFKRAVELDSSFVRTKEFLEDFESQASKSNH